MVERLRALGWRVEAHELPGRFPGADAVGREALDATLASLPDASRVVIDGLAMGGLPEVVEARAGRLRIVSLVHHPLAEETGLSAPAARRFRESERRALAPCAGVIVSSAFTARVLADFDVPAERVRVVVPGTEPARPAAGPAPGEPPVLLCVASVTPRKGHEVLVAALERVRDLPWRCVCVGALDRDPEHARAVLRQVVDADLAGRVDFVGERTGARLDETYHGASLFVLASRYEGYGMALAEALARGLPIVSTTGGAIPHTVPSDAGVLLRALLAPDGRARAERTAAARLHAATLPDWRAAARAFAAAVDELTR
jgi:glycosyltransferase involved in cell wall biosynthesis